MSLDWLSDAGLVPGVHARLVELETALWADVTDPVPGLMLRPPAR